MYTTIERENLLHQLIDYCKTIKKVQGFLLVGSGATGFRDECSDLDVLIVVENSEDTELVQKVLHDFIHNYNKVLMSKLYRHEEDIFVICYLFDNYLELDLGIWSFKKIRATKPYWKLIYDVKNNIQEKLEETLKLHEVPCFEDVIKDSISFTWQFVHSASIAIKRNNLLKAVKDIDVLRDKIIQFICIKNGVLYDFDKNFDRLDGPFVSRLIKTYEIRMDAVYITQSLHEVIALYFDVIYDELGDNEEIKNNEQILLAYMEHMH
jgi:predicted nucleotidyltransferase